MNDSFDKAQRAYDAMEPEYAKPCVRCLAEEHFDLNQIACDALINANAYPALGLEFVHEQRKAIDYLRDAFEEALKSYYEEDAEMCDEHKRSKADEE